MATHLLDKSAWVRLTVPAVYQRWGADLTRGRLAVTGIGMLEILVSAQSSASFVSVRSALGAMPRLAVTETIIERALDVQQSMVSRGTHRAPSPADFILAACAEANELAVLHFDKDFDLIAEVTGQRSEWILPHGSVA